MARRTRRSKSRAARWLTFWSVVLMLCVLVGAASFWVGKYVIGEKLEAGTPVREITTRLLQDDDDKPPSRPMVEVMPADRPPLATTPGDEENQESEGADEDEEEATPEEERRGRDAEARVDREPRRGETRAERPEPPRPAERTTPPMTRAATPREYVVRAGSFTDPAYLQERKAALQERGYQFWITPHERDGRIYYRVNVGEFPTEAEARRLQRELVQQGIDADVAAKAGD